MKTKIDMGVVAALLAPFFIALSIILTKMAGELANPLVISALGSLFAVPCLLLINRVTKTPLELKQLATELKTPTIKVLITRSILGQVLINTGFTLTSAIKAVLLLRVEPIFVFTWSVLRREEKPTARKIALLLILLFGTVLVVAPQGQLSGPNLGDGLVVLSLLFLSYSYIPTKEVVSQGSAEGLNIITSLAGGLIVGFFALFACSPQAYVLSAKAYLLIAAYSVVFFVIAATLYFYAFKTLKPWVISAFLSLEVVFGLALAAVLLHESMTPIQGIGTAIVLGATFAIGRVAPEVDSDG